MQTDNYNKTVINTASFEGMKLWRKLSILARYQIGIKALARYYRNKIVKEGLTKSEKQKAVKMLNDWGY